MTVAKNTPGFVSLDYVVNFVLADMDDFTSHKKKKIVQYVAHGFRDLRMFVLSNVEVEYLDISTANTATLPSDYINYTKIGIVINGRIHALTMDDDLDLIERTDACGDPIPLDTTCDDSSDVNYGYFSFPFVSHFRNGQYVGEMYGIRGGKGIASFRIDKNSGQIIFDGRIPKGVNQVVVEYVSSGLKVGGGTVIPVQAVETLRQYAHYQLAENSNKSTESEISRREKNYIRAYSKLQMFEHSFTKEDYLDHFRRHSTPIPRT